MQDIDSVPSNIQSANREALLFVFEDNEAVIKMIMKGRSPTMRHVSRTHRVALDWLFDRINLDPKIQIKYIDTKNQLADILTKGIMFLTIERGNPLKCQDQTIYKRIMVYLGLLKSGRVEMENTIDQGNLMKILGIHCENSTLIVKNIFSAGLRILQGTKRLFTIERGNLCQRIFKERLILKISSWEVR